MSEQEDTKALRGMWGANRGPKMSQKKRQSRKVATVNLEPEIQEGQAKGWKANR